LSKGERHFSENRALAAGGPAAGDFLLCGQKKVTKEKPPRLAGPAGFPALLAISGGCATRAMTRHESMPWA
jgi:hypothetical protein